MHHHHHCFESLEQRFLSPENLSRYANIASMLTVLLCTTALVLLTELYERLHGQIQTKELCVMGIKGFML